MIESFFIGCPFEFKKKCLVYPPSIKEVCTTPEYPLFFKLMTITQEEIEDEFVKANVDLSKLLTPMEYLLNYAYNDKNLESIIKKGFEFFIHENVTFLYTKKLIILGDITEIQDISMMRTLSEEDYFEFQNLIRQSCGGKCVEKPDPNENEKIKAMKAKARYRDQIKAKKGDGLRLETLMASLCCMNLGLNPLNIGELSYAAVPILMETYQQKEKYELDIKSLLAGADSKKIKPKYWIRNLEN